MVFGPTPMRRIYLAVPIEYEDQVLTKIGDLGTVQLIREFQTKRPERNRIIEISQRYERLNEKLDIILTEQAVKGLPQPEVKPLPLEVACEETERLVTIAEAELNDLIGTLDRLQRGLKETRSLKEKLAFLAAIGLGTDEVGTFRHIFVKIGFMKSSLTTRLSTYISGTSVQSISLSGRPKENFMVVTGLSEDRAFAEQTLRLLNFEEITIPNGLKSDPKLALVQVEGQIKSEEEQITKTNEGLLKLRARTAPYSSCVREAVLYEEAKELVIRTKTKSLIHGWVPRSKFSTLQTELEHVVPKDSIYMKTEEPKPEDDVPVQFTSRGLVRAFEFLTFLQGVPNYFEVNPTPIYMLLYAVMFGMMFGDIGSGLVLIIIGALMTRLRRGLFAFSARATKQIAYIMISCGFSTVVFGGFYGIFFLQRTPFPSLLSPLTNIAEIIIIAIAFGVAQIILSLILNIINMFRRKEPLKIVLGERGIIGLAFYASGVVVGYAFVLQRNFTVFFQGDIAIFTSICILALILIFLSPLIESWLKHETPAKSQKLLEGFGLGLEAFIAFIANSVSYIRLAAFAIAHEAIAIAAVVLGSVLGTIAALVVMNGLDFVIEGFASFIQALRLMYYEFSTRFFLKDGIAYRPFKVGPVRVKI